MRTVCGLGLVDHQLAVLDVVAHRHEAAHPHAALAGGRELVADALADDLALELGEAQQDVERQPPHGGRGVEGLRDRHEGDVVPVEHLDQLGEVHQRAAEAVDLVDDDDVDEPGLDVGEQLLQGRALQRAAGEAAVVIALADGGPAFRLLAGDIGLAGLALGVEGVELHVEAFLGGLAGVDGAARALRHRCSTDDMLMRRSSCLLAQAEEPKAVPVRAGDGLGDRGERLVFPALPFVAIMAAR